MSSACAAVAAIPGGIAAAYVAAPRIARSVRLAPRSQLSLAGAPVGLRAAVRRTLGLGDGSLRSPSQEAELTGKPGYGEVGFSVAIYGSTAVLGVPGHLQTGAAYVFVRSGTSWKRQAKLTAGAPGDGFGSSVAIYGSTAVVGTGTGRRTCSCAGARPGQSRRDQAAATMPACSATTRGSVAQVFPFTR